MKRVFLVTAAFVPLLALALPSQAIPPPSPPVDFPLTKAVPHAGTKFTGLLLQTDRSDEGTVRLEGLSCDATLTTHRLRAKIQKWYFGTRLSAVSCSWSLPKGSAGSVLEETTNFHYSVLDFGGNPAGGGEGSFDRAWRVRR